ncbi:MAG: hypothetical protein JNL32_10135 [Candidatus Kapabacteria bacterium]|nr:hypothetical protein [Candidatus Kapabacteria bacterium]
MGVRRILFICGSLNQTSMMHSIAQQMPDVAAYFTPYYADGLIDALARRGYLDFTILGGQFKQSTMEYLESHNLTIDEYGRRHEYDAVVTCQDLIIPRNIRSRSVVLVQEGMTDPENFIYHVVKLLKLPRYFASTAATGLSNRYTAFCVASEGYKHLFMSKGADMRKLIVTGIPNFDNCRAYTHNTFPYSGYTLCATSDMRETYKYENRKAFIERARRIAGASQLIFKLHPNENHSRAMDEIRKYAPEALALCTGNAHEMVANCSTFITRYSSLVFTAAALGKTLHSDMDEAHVRWLMPVQNGGTSSRAIADVCRMVLEQKTVNAGQARTVRHHHHVVYPHYDVNVQ